jgi:hypothetical protein
VDKPVFPFSFNIYRQIKTCVKRIFVFWEKCGCFSNGLSVLWTVFLYPLPAASFSVSKKAV